MVYGGSLQLKALPSNTRLSVSHTAMPWRAFIMQNTEMSAFATSPPPSFGVKQPQSSIGAYPIETRLTDVNWPFPGSDDKSFEVFGAEVLELPVVGSGSECSDLSYTCSVHSLDDATSSDYYDMEVRGLYIKRGFTHEEFVKALRKDAKLSGDTFECFESFEEYRFLHQQYNGLPMPEKVSAVKSFKCGQYFFGRFKKLRNRGRLHRMVYCDKAVSLLSMVEPEVRELLTASDVRFVNTLSHYKAPMLKEIFSSLMHMGYTPEDMLDFSKRKVNSGAMSVWPLAWEDGMPCGVIFHIGSAASYTRQRQALIDWWWRTPKPEVEEEAYIDGPVYFDRPYARSARARRVLRARGKQGWRHSKRLAKQYGRCRLSRSEYFYGRSNYEYLVRFAHLADSWGPEVMPRSQMQGVRLYRRYGAFLLESPDNIVRLEKRVCFERRSDVYRHSRWRAKYSVAFEEERWRNDVYALKDYVGFQSGLSRQDREVKQVEAARKRIKKAFKDMPKNTRKQTVKDAKRSFRRRLVEETLRDSLEGVHLQGGIETALKVSAGAALALGARSLMDGFLRIHGLVTKSEKVVDATTSILDMLTCFKNAIVKHLGGVLWLVPCVMGIRFLLSQSKLPPVFANTLLPAVAAFFGRDLWSVIQDHFELKKVDVPESGAVPQSGISDWAPQLLASVMAFSVFKGNNRNVAGEFMKRISMLDRASQGLETFFKWVVAGVEVCVNYVRSKFGKPSIELYEKPHKSMLNWAERVDALSVDDVVDPGSLGAVYLDKVIALLREGESYRNTYRETPLSRGINEAMAKLNNILQPHVGALNARNNYRFEPRFTLLYGAPGVGKSLMATVFCATVMKLSGLSPPDASYENVVSNLWQKGSGKFWNSYAGQTSVVVDDIFQERVSTSDEESDYMNIIRMVGSWAYPLNFADLTSKGKIFFSSKYIFGTTNLRSIVSEASQVIHEPAAVARRITHPVHLHVNAEFMTPAGRLDYQKYCEECEKLSGGQGIETFPWHIWYVTKHNFEAGYSDNRRTPLRVFVEEVAADMRSAIKSHGVQESFLQRFVSELRPQEEVIPEPELIAPVPALPEIQPQSGLQFAAGFLGILMATSRARKSVWRSILNTREKGGIAGWLACAYDDFYSNHRSFVVHAEIFLTVYLMYQVTMLCLPSIIKILLGPIIGFFRGGGGGPRVQSNRALSTKRHHELRNNDVRLQAGDQTVARNAYSNSYKLWIGTGGSAVVVGQILFVNSDIAVCPTHYFSDMERRLRPGGGLSVRDEICFRSAANFDHKFTMTVDEFMTFERVTVPDTEVQFVRFRGINAQRKIVSSFVKENDLRYISNKRLRLDVCKIEREGKFASDSSRLVYLSPSCKLKEAMQFSGIVLNRSFEYTAPTRSGDCGAPVSIFDNSSFQGRTIVGLHVAGRETHDQGWCSIITQEMINEAFTKFTNVIIDNFEEDFASKRNLQSGLRYTPEDFEVMGSFQALGVINRPAVVAPFSRLYKVPTHYGCLGPFDYMPAPMSPVMRDGEIVIPMRKALEPYATPLLHIEEPLLCHALHVALRPFTAHSINAYRGIYTFEQAVVGIEQEKFRSIPRNTSPGFPYIFDVRHGKKEFFGFGEGPYDLSSKECAELKERVLFVVDEAKKGNRCAHVFVDFLKDELRSPEKVEKVKTRMISSAPLDYVIAWRMLFGAFSASFMQDHVESGMAPGINVYQEWGVLADKIRSKGSRVFDGDFVAFDSSEQPVPYDEVLTYINAWYGDGPELALARKVLWMDLVHSRHLGGDGRDQRYVYQWNKSLPSGHPFTTIGNSIYSLLVLVTSFLKVYGPGADFWHDVFACTYGDDNVVNVSDRVSDSFNQVVVARMAREIFGMEYTSSKKDGVLVPYTTIDNVSFLKRAFSFIEGKWFAPLELKSFLYNFYWCKNKMLEQEIVLDGLEFALEELSLHPSSVWAEYAPKLHSLVLEQSLKFPDKGSPRAALDQKAYRDIVSARSDSWW